MTSLFALLPQKRKNDVDELSEVRGSNQGRLEYTIYGCEKKIKYLQGTPRLATGKDMDSKDDMGIHLSHMGLSSV